MNILIAITRVVLNHILMNPPYNTEMASSIKLGTGIPLSMWCIDAMQSLFIPSPTFLRSEASGAR